MKKNETGRSMVEMLGVLAIIGVLSIGGIAGYRVAMEKNKLNEISHDLEVATVLLAADGDFSKIEGSGYSLEPVEATMPPDWERKPSGFIKIMVDVENKEECLKILEQLPEHFATGYLECYGDYM